MRDIDRPREEHENNSEERTEFFHEFIDTINHSWLTNQRARIDLVISK